MILAVRPPRVADRAAVGGSDRLGSRSGYLPLFRARSDCPDARSDHQPWPTVESSEEHGASAEERALEPHRESHPTKNV
jgi:hypothetical protein